MWNKLDTDFGDETANFGPRQEAGTALFQLDTIATVSCEDQDNNRFPKNVAAVLGDLTALAVDKSLVVQSSTILAFDYEIEEVEWSLDGSLIIVGVTGGSLYVLDAESTEIIFSINFVPEERKVNGRSFRRILCSGTGELVILTADGQVIVVQDVNVFKTGGENIGQAIKENICMGSTSDQHSTVHDMVIRGDYIYTLGEGESILAKWNFRHGSIELEDAMESFLLTGAYFRRGTGTTDGHYLFLLDSNDHVSIWDAETFVCLRHFPDLVVSDLCLLETNTSQNNSLQDMKLVLTLPRDGQCHLHVQTLPAWETVYSLQLSDNSQLAKCNTFQDSIYITEFPLNESAPNLVTTARFRCLNETDPKTRLYRILQKHKFEEAEQFARDFQLEIELVHKVKSNYLINELSPWNVGKYNADQVRDMMAQLMECLKTIVDDLHTAESCMSAALPTYTDTEDMLAYCKQRVDKATASKDPDVKEKLILLSGRLLDIQHRLLTFKLAFGEGGYSGEKWQRFMVANLLHEALNWLDSGHLDTGFIVWTRHQAEWSADTINSELILQVLSTVPSDTPPSTMLGYISTGLIPVVMRAVPEALYCIVCYLVEKAKSMEQSDKSNWPASAISFSEFIYERLLEATRVVMDKDTCMACDNTNKTRLKCDATLEPLHTLIQKLKQLDDVLHKYRCKLSLEKFLKETRETIAFRMLDKVVALELIAPTLERQIRPYMKEHGLNQDQIFSKYIKDLLERHGPVQSYTGKAFWEAKASAVIDCITDPEQKIEGILEVMKWAAIPWSTDVEQLVNMGLKLNHNKIARLKEQCHRIHVRKMMMKHGLKNVDLPSGSDAVRLVYFILTRDQPGCVEDAREILQLCGKDALETDLYDFRMRQLIQADRIEEGLELLRGLPTKLGMKIGHHVMTYTNVKLNFGVEIAGLEDQEHKEKQLFTEAAIHICKYLQTIVQDNVDVLDLKAEEKVLISMFALQVEYEMYPTVTQYEDLDYRMTVMHTYLKDFFAAQKQQGSYSKLYRLSDILQINQATIKGQMAIKFANAGDIDMAVQICGELYESTPTQETADVLCKVVQAFLGLQAEVTAEDDDVDTNKLRVLPELCHRLASQATCICEPDNLCQYLELCKTCSLLKSVSQQCESGDSTLSAQWGEGEEFSLDKAREWSGDLSLDVFQEDALLLSSVTALPLVSLYALQNPLVPSSQDKPSETEGEPEKESESPAGALCNSVIPVVQFLRDSGHLQLAFSFSIHMLNTLTQYTQQQDMGLPIYLESQKEKLGGEKAALQKLEQTSQGMLKDLVSHLMMKIFNSTRADVQLALTYLSTRPRREVMDIMMRLIKTSGNQYKKLKSIAWVGIGLGEMLKQPEVISQFQLLETNASWGYRLNKMKIPLKGSVLGPKSEKHNLLPVIAQNELADTDMVKEFCQAFELDQNCGLLLYLDHLFVPEEEAGFSQRQNVAVNIARAREAIQEIRAEEQLLSRIKKIYYRTSAYDYETLEFTLKELASRSSDSDDIPVEKGLKLLEYLRVYTRRAPPSDYEMEYRPSREKKESQICMTALAPESKTRLPIHPLLQGDPWKIITPELRRETIDTWLLIAKLLMLSHDQICLTAVQNMVRVYSEMYSSPDGGLDMSHWHWQHEQANFSLLEDVSHILNNIKSCESSLACAKWMVSKLPLGSEKVLVLKQCVKLAELWHLSIPEESAKREKARMAYLKFLKHWQKMASAQALCLHALGDPDLLQCTEKPEGLIQKLYEHPSVTQTTWETGASKPDVHGAAEQIAEINDIPLERVQGDLIHNWLLDTSGTGQQEAETTMTFNLENLKFDDAAASREEDNEEINFKRIVYLVQRSNQDTNLILLLEYAFKPKEGQNIISSIRALRCLLYICDETMIEQTCGRSLEEIRTNLHVMIYLSSLEKLHIRHTLDTFVSCQKESLVKGIWKNHSHERTAITLVSCLCLDYKIYDLQLWVGILQRLQTYGLMRQLEYVLLRLNNVQDLWSVQSFPKMWYTVVHSALDKVCPPLTKKHTDTCVHYFNLLLTCPVLKAMDTDSLSRDYQRLDMPACALGCLLMNKNTNDSVIQGLVSKLGKQILENTTSLLQSGMNHGICRKLADLVYAYIISVERFAEILNTPYQNDFISHCVRTKRVDGALVFAIRHNKIGEARGLFDIYIGTYPDISMKLTGYIDEDEEEDESLELTIVLLKAYLRMQNLEDVALLL